MSKKQPLGGAKIPSNKKSESGVKSDGGLKADGIIEFGFYCQRLKKVKSIEYLHNVYKKDPGNMDAFKNLYSEYFPEGIKFYQWKFNPECETCREFAPNDVEPCCGNSPQRPPVCTSYVHTLKGES